MTQFWYFSTQFKKKKIHVSVKLTEQQFPVAQIICFSNGNSLKVTISEDSLLFEEEINKSSLLRRGHSIILCSMPLKIIAWKYSIDRLRKELWTTKQKKTKWFKKSMLIFRPQLQNIYDCRNSTAKQHWFIFPFLHSYIHLSTFK